MDYKSDTTTHVVLPTISFSKPMTPGSASLTGRVLPEWKSEDPTLRKLYSRSSQSRNHVRFVEKQLERQRLHEQKSQAKKSKTRVKGDWPPRATVKLNEETETSLVGDSNHVLYRITNPLEKSSSLIDSRGGSTSVGSIVRNAALNNAFLTNTSISNMDSIGSGGGGGGGGEGTIGGSGSGNYLVDRSLTTVEKEYSVRQIMMEKERKEMEHLRRETRTNGILNRTSAMDANEGGRFTMDSDERSFSQKEADSARDRHLSDSLTRLKWRRVPLGEPAISTMQLEQQNMSPPRLDFQTQYQKAFLDQQNQFEEQGREYSHHYANYRAHMSHNRSIHSSSNTSLAGDDNRSIRTNQSRDQHSYDSLNKTEKEIKSDTHQIYEIISGKADMGEKEADDESVHSNLSESSLNPLSISTSFSFAKLDGHPHMEVSIKPGGKDEEDDEGGGGSLHYDLHKSNSSGRSRGSKKSKKKTKDASTSSQKGSSSGGGVQDLNKPMKRKLVNKTIKPGDVINNILSQRTSASSRPGTTHSSSSKRNEMENIDDYYIPCSLNNCPNESCFWSDDEKRAYCASCWSQCPYHVTIGVKVSKLLNKGKNGQEDNGEGGFFEQQQSQHRKIQMQKEQERQEDYLVRQRRTDTNISSSISTTWSVQNQTKAGDGISGNDNDNDNNNDMEAYMIHDELTSLSLNSLNSSNNDLTSKLDMTATLNSFSNTQQLPLETSPNLPTTQPTTTTRRRNTSSRGDGGEPLLASNFGGRNVKLDHRYSNSNSTSSYDRHQMKKSIFGFEEVPGLVDNAENAQVYAYQNNKIKYNHHMQNGRYFKSISKGFGCQEFSKFVHEKEEEIKNINQSTVNQSIGDSSDGMNISMRDGVGDGSLVSAMIKPAPYFSSGSISSNRSLYKLPVAKLIIKKEKDEEDEDGGGVENNQFDINNNDIYDINNSPNVRKGKDHLTQDFNDDTLYGEDGYKAEKSSLNNNSHNHVVSSGASGSGSGGGGGGGGANNNHIYANVHTVHSSSEVADVSTMEPTVSGYVPPKTVVSIRLHRPAVMPSTPPSPPLHPPTSLISNSMTSSTSQQVQQQQQQQHLISPQEARRRSQDTMVISGMAHDYSHRRASLKKRRSFIGVKGYNEATHNSPSSNSHPHSSPSNHHNLSKQTDKVGVGSSDILSLEGFIVNPEDEYRSTTPPTTRTPTVHLFSTSSLNEDSVHHHHQGRMNSPTASSIQSSSPCVLSPPPPAIAVLSTRTSSVMPKLSGTFDTFDN